MYFQTSIMHKITFIFLILLCVACKKRDRQASALPDCIEQIINDPIRSQTLKTVSVQKIGREFHYWLNTDARHLDGAEVFVNGSCDTICFISEWTNCPDTYYSFDDWEVIWKK